MDTLKFETDGTHFPATQVAAPPKGKGKSAGRGSCQDYIRQNTKEWLQFDHRKKSREAAVVAIAGAATAPAGLLAIADAATAPAAVAASELVAVAATPDAPPPGLGPEEAAGPAPPPPPPAQMLPGFVPGPPPPWMGKPPVPPRLLAPKLPPPKLPAPMARLATIGESVLPDVDPGSLEALASEAVMAGDGN